MTRWRWLALAALPVIGGPPAGCAHLPTARAPTAPAPDTSGTLRLIGYRGLAQGCPITETLLLTARHVATEDDDTGDVRKRAFIWSDAAGHTGSAWAEDYDLRRDVAVMRSDRPFARVYQLARDAPQQGERVTIVGYDFTAALTPKVVTVKVLNVVSAHLILSAGAERGVSGSCVLNANNEVVGIFHSGVSHGYREVGIASGVWGEWASVSWTPK